MIEGRKIKAEATRRVQAFSRRAKDGILRATSMLMSERGRRRRTFQEVYSRGLWGHEANSKFFSGVGSRGEAVNDYVDFMAKLLQRHAEDIGRPLVVVDLGCGDFQVGQALLAKLPGFAYVGCDIVPELIKHNRLAFGNETTRFQQVDIVTDALPEGDVCLVRQVLQHLSNADILAFFRNAKFEWIYVTEGHPIERVGPTNPDKAAGSDVRFDWRTGRGRGVEFDKPPFGLAAEEVLRVHQPPFEVIVTERVARRAGYPSRQTAPAS